MNELQSSEIPPDSSLPNMPENILDVVIMPSENGLTKERLNLSEQASEVTDDIMLNDILKIKEELKETFRKKENTSPKSDEGESSMQESVQEGRKTTLKTKLIVSELGTLLMTLSETLAQDLTTTEKDFDKSWITRIGENLRRLWLPTKTDSVDGDLKSLKICSSMFQGEGLLSLQNLKLPLNRSSARISSQSSPCLQPVYTVKEDTENEEEKEEKSCYKIRKYRILLPRKKEERMRLIEQLENDFGAFRWYCNFTLDVILPAFEEVLKAREKIDPLIKEIEAAHAVRKSIVDKILAGAKKNRSEGDCKILDELAKDEKRQIDKECYLEKRPIYHQYRFYRMCKGSELNYQNARDELKRSVLKEAVQNSKGQLCNVVEEDDSKNKLPTARWMSETGFKIHNRIPRGALKKTIQDLKSAVSNWRNGNIRTFEFSRRTKKQDRQILHFEDTSLPAYLKNLEMVYRHGRKLVKRNPTLTSGCEIIHDKLDDKYYITIPEKYDPTPLTDENQVRLNEKTIVFDEGIRAFLSGYVPDTCTVEFGADPYRLLRILAKSDKIKSRISGLKDQALIAKLWKKIRVLNRRLKAKITDLHWKICRFISLNFSTVIIPKFPVKEIAKALGLNHQSKRLLYLFSHYAFKQKLAFKGRENGFQTFLVNEDWTSQTCGKCQSLHKTKSKTYVCPRCGVTIDRDLNGARNILLKFLTELCRPLSGFV